MSSTDTRHVERSFCRICAANCGTLVALDPDGTVESIKGNPEHALTGGYTCSKGRDAASMHARSDRILRPLKRQPDGSWLAIPLEVALDEVAERLGTVLDQHGPVSVASFLGTAGFNNASLTVMLPAWMKAIGSPSYFSSVTIDQSAKIVTSGRLGAWHAGRQTFATSDVWLVFGNNVLVSHCGGGGLPTASPAVRLKAAKRRGLKLIVVDPRYTETARYADLFVQPKPGEDAALVAGMLRLILEEGLWDKTFSARWVDEDSLVELSQAVQPFTPEYVERRSGVPAATLVRMVEMFTSAKRGCAAGSTGVSMSPRSNLIYHLIECLNVLCGRYAREGDLVENPDVLAARRPRHEGVVPPTRSWERGHRLRTKGLGAQRTELMGDELPASALPEEILLPGEGQIRALLVAGGNPVAAIPDQKKVAGAFSELDLLVSIEPYMTATAQLSHYVIPPTLMYERSDFPMLFGMGTRLPSPFAIYTKPIAGRPAGSDLADDWYVFWALAARLEATIEFDGVSLDMAHAPSTDDLLALIARDSQVPFEEIRDSPDGRIFDVPPQYVTAAPPDWTDKFEILPDDVEAELNAYLDDGGLASGHDRDTADFPFRFTVRRMSHVMNSYRPPRTGRSRYVDHNSAYVHPDDPDELRLASGDRVRVVSESGEIPAMSSPMIGSVAGRSRCHTAGVFPRTVPRPTKQGGRTSIC